VVCLASGEAIEERAGWADGACAAAQGGKGLQRDYVDPYSSAPHFQGWQVRTWTSKQLAGEPVTAEPTTWLLRVGWRRHGPLDPNAVPGPMPARARG
jgi:hypothetical protein